MKAPPNPILADYLHCRDMAGEARSERIDAQRRERDALEQESAAALALILASDGKPVHYIDDRTGFDYEVRPVVAMKFRRITK